MEEITVSIKIHAQQGQGEHKEKETRTIGQICHQLVSILEGGIKKGSDQYMTLKVESSGDVYEVEETEFVINTRMKADRNYWVEI